MCILCVIACVCDYQCVHVCVVSIYYIKYMCVCMCVTKFTALLLINSSSQKEERRKMAEAESDAEGWVLVTGTGRHRAVPRTGDEGLGKEDSKQKMETVNQHGRGVKGY